MHCYGAARGDVHLRQRASKDGETPLLDGLGSERTVTNTAGAVQGSLTTSTFGGTVTLRVLH